MNIHIGSGEISIVKGDISAQETDAIVNAANNHLWMGSGVAGAIKRRGGSQIEQEAVSQGPIDVGQVILTTAGSLKTKAVIHAAVMGQDLHTSAELIKRSTHASFCLAEQKQFHSISIPALGTGVGGFSLHHCATLMIGEAIEFLLGARNLHQIRFVLYNDEAKTIFEHELKDRFSAARHH
ncbi:MAG: macro domain-containing protein [bacterium]